MFTKEYIELCKNKKIQELRPILENDWYFSYNEIRFVKINKYMEGLRNVCYWLPTGDQLDEEIIKICKENIWIYRTGYAGADIYYAVVETGIRDIYFNSDNLVIAKIKLLLELLNTND